MKFVKDSSGKKLTKFDLCCIMYSNRLKKTSGFNYWKYHTIYHCSDCYSYSEVANFYSEYCAL